MNENGQLDNKRDNQTIVNRREARYHPFYTLIWKSCYYWIHWKVPQEKGTFPVTFHLFQQYVFPAITFESFVSSLGLRARLRFVP